MNIRKIHPAVSKSEIRIGSVSAFRAEASARPKPKWLKKLDRHASKNALIEKPKLIKPA